MIIRKEYLANAQRIGVELRESSNFRKLLDVYKDGQFVCHIGTTNHPTLFDLLDKYGEEKAYLADLKRTKRNTCNNSVEYLYETRILWWYQFREFGLKIQCNGENNNVCVNYGDPER